MREHLPSDDLSVIVHSNIQCVRGKYGELNEVSGRYSNFAFRLFIESMCRVLWLRWSDCDLVRSLAMRGGLGRRQSGESCHNAESGFIDHAPPD